MGSEGMTPSISRVRAKAAGTMANHLAIIGRTNEKASSRLKKVGETSTKIRGLWGSTKVPPSFEDLRSGVLKKPRRGKGKCLENRGHKKSEMAQAPLLNDPVHHWWEGGGDKP